MRLTKEQTEQNRRTILDAAGRLFRERGFDGVGVADIMKAAGFTHGGFYNHFESKEALAAEVCSAAIKSGNERIACSFEADGGPRPWAKLVDGYLSKPHRDGLAGGCTISALASDAARQTAEVQQGFAEGVTELLAVLTDGFARSEGLTKKAARQKAVRSWAELVGALVLSRGVHASDADLADEILATSRKGLQSPA